MAHARAHTEWWRVAVGILCGVLAAFALIASIVTHYVRDNILDTEHFVAIVGPLPQNPTIAAAVAQFTTGKLFESGKAQNAIANALPPKLAPLAGPLSDTLQKTVTQVTTTAVQSDQFFSIWNAAIRLAQTRVLKVADANGTPLADKAQTALANVDLSALINTVRNKLPGDQPFLTDVEQTTGQASTVVVNLKQNVQQLQQTVRWVRGSAATLPYVFAALVLISVAVSYNRRHALIYMSITVIAVGAIMLVVFKMASNSLLEGITTAVYRDAARIVYEAFYDPLRQRISWTMLGGAVLLVLAILSGPYAWTVWLRQKTHLTDLQKTVVYDWARTVRWFVKTYFWWLCGAAAVSVVVVLLVMDTVTTTTLVTSLSLLVAFIALAHIIAVPAPNRLHAGHPSKK